MIWLTNEIADGLSALLALRLRNAPPEDTIDKIADIWELAFSRRVSVEHLDAHRVREGFVRILPEATEWPTPKQVLDKMPNRPQLPSLPPPALRDEEWERGQALFRELIEGAVDAVAPKFHTTMTAQRLMRCSQCGGEIPPGRSYEQTTHAGREAVADEVRCMACARIRSNV